MSNDNQNKEDISEKEKAEGVTRDAATGAFGYREGKRWPATVALVVPFMFLLIPIFNAIRKEINWKAALATIGTFEIVMFCAEKFAIGRGHWVWNDNRILGFKIWGIPIEEPLLYYWFGPLFVIIILLAVRHKLAEMKNQ